jgi:dTMP kinase
LARGRLIALEGADGTGKTIQASLLATALGAVLTREPGGTALGERLRSILLEREGIKITPKAEALLMLAQRAEHTACVLVPALEAGRWVVTDRYTGSTLAYQGYGRGLGIEELALACSWATEGLEPDLSVLLQLSQAEARRRQAGRGHLADRLEDEADSFHDRVAAGYRSLAEADPLRWAVVDASGTVDEVAARVLGVVRQRLGPLRTT